MLRTRLWTALIALPTLLAVVLFAPAIVFSVFIGILGGWGLYEIAAMTEAGVSEGLILAVLGAAPLIALLLGFGTGLWIAPTLVIVAMTALIAGVSQRGGAAMPQRILVPLGALWVGVLFPYFALVRNRQNGIAIIILMLLVVVASDSGAYFVGRSFGKIKLMPLVSPSKTVEGAIGGLVASVAAGLILRVPLVPELSAISVAWLSAAIGILAQIGDLANSAFKRIAGVKDSGWIFPGHGGLLDRTCSLVFAAVFAYYWFY